MRVRTWCCKGGVRLPGCGGTEKFTGAALYLAFPAFATPAKFFAVVFVRDADLKQPGLGRGERLATQMDFSQRGKAFKRTGMCREVCAEKCDRSAEAI